MSNDLTCLILVVFLNFSLASLLTFWHLPITASVTIESVPPLMTEGDNILFLVDNLPEKTVTLVWFKGLTNMKAVIAIYGRHINLSASGHLHSGRETIYYNGYLLIKKITQKDTGFYTLWSYDKYLNIISTTSTYIHVYGKWFVVNFLSWVRFISLDTHRKVGLCLLSRSIVPLFWSLSI